MNILQHITEVQIYCKTHLGITLTEYWLDQIRAERLRVQLEDVVLIECKDLEGHTGIIISGMVIKIIGKHDTQCQHYTKSHFQDVGEVYCHDCRTIIGEQIPTATHRRSSNIGPQA